MLKPVLRVSRSIWRATGNVEGERAIPEETAVAFSLAIARKDGFEVFTYSHRVKGELASHVA